jgi:purine-binding chemotaxis protein CheW
MAPTLTPDAPELERAECTLIEQLVIFYVCGQRYAFALEDVQEIQQIVALAEVPDAVDGVLGMVNLRGQVIPAVDLNERLGAEPVSRNLETPMIVARYRNGLVALVVDAVDDVLAVPADCMQEPPSLHPLSSVMHGVARLDVGLVYVLDAARLLDQKVNLA